MKLYSFRKNSFVDHEIITYIVSAAGDAITNTSCAPHVATDLAAHLLRRLPLRTLSLEGTQMSPTQ